MHTDFRILLALLSVFLVVPQSYASPLGNNCRALLETTSSLDDEAENASLVYLTDRPPGYTREVETHSTREAGGKEKLVYKFTYYDMNGRKVEDPQLLAYFKSLQIPPAHSDVWISPNPRTHILAIGKDSRGRPQYRYHPEWDELRADKKFSRMTEFGSALSEARIKIQQDLLQKKDPKDRILAAIALILETGSIRVGSERYALENGSYGLTTLRKEHVSVAGDRIKFSFLGKSKKYHDFELRIPESAAVVKELLRNDGEEIFAGIDAEKVNQYLRSRFGEKISAKDFRTWVGTVTAARTLIELSPPTSQKEIQAHIKAAVEAASEQLRNEPAVCKKNYIHPKVLELYSDRARFESALDRAKRTKLEKGQRFEEKFVLELLATTSGE